MPIFETTFAKYVSDEPPLEGGAGRVYRVRDEDENVFALKLLKPENLSRQRLKRFKNELMFCKQERHPNIVRVIDDGYVVGKAGVKSPFYVMPHYALTLRNLIQKGIAPNNVLPLFSQMMDGWKHHISSV